MTWRCAKCDGQSPALQFYRSGQSCRDTQAGHDFEHFHVTCRDCGAISLLPSPVTRDSDGRVLVNG